MKKIALSITVLIMVTLTSCNKEKKKMEPKNMAQTEEQDIRASKGYNLMKTNCFICHFEKPDPSKRDQMIAPPMLRVQEHYKPSYPKKDEFIKAIKTWVTNPTEDKIMMPGAVRKFNIMPKLVVADEDLQLIAETLYDIDFGNMPKMHNQNSNKLTLNNGEKWQLNKSSKKIIATINKQLNSFKSDNIEAYNQLGKDVFANVKTILLDKSYTEDTFSQIQKFFHNIEGNIHNLIAAKTIDKAKKEQNILLKKFNKFNQFFE